MKIIFSILFSFISFVSFAQEYMTAEQLWTLGKVSALGVTPDGEKVIYRVSHYDLTENKSTKKYYSIKISNGKSKEIKSPEKYLSDLYISPDGKYKLYDKEVKISKVSGADHYPSLDKSKVQIYDNLMYRHWDTWSDGSYSHVHYSRIDGSNEIDLMTDQSYHCPTRPFGGTEDYCWGPEGKQILYVTKHAVGVDYTQSTNTDIFSYDLEKKTTTNLTEGMMGYDNSPAFSKNGHLAWLSMARDGYESDKNDIIVSDGKQKINLTKNWDGTVFAFVWSEDGRQIYFTAPVDGTRQLFSVDFLGKTTRMSGVKQLTKGQWDVRGIVGQSQNKMIVSRGDMNQSTELYTVNLENGKMKQLTKVNNDIYASLKLGKVEKRMTTTTDNKEMLSWVIYPPDFDPKKKYPTLLYCQGGPQGALSQFYSVRWNFQLMAAKGYIIIAPNRRGMPGHGVEWNEQISKDYGGQNMRDYLSAIDDIATESYVDKDRLGAVGASYGGYSVFYLAGIHENRFKSFIAHDGLFNLRSMYGTTEELFFVNWDLGGNYWDKDNAAAQKTYAQFDPSSMVDKWNTPILIYQGGKDYRVPIGQSLEAFQAAQLKGIKSRLVYLPEENHWVLSAQNGIVWQNEFFRWLKETL